MRSISLAWSQVYHTERPRYLFVARSPCWSASRGIVSDSADPCAQGDPSLLTLKCHIFTHHICNSLIFPALAKCILLLCRNGRVNKIQSVIILLCWQISTPKSLCPVRCLLHRSVCRLYGFASHSSSNSNERSK